MSAWHFRQYSSIISACRETKVPSTLRALAGCNYFAPSAEPQADGDEGEAEFHRPPVRAAPRRREVGPAKEQEGTDEGHAYQDMGQRHPQRKNRRVLSAKPAQGADGEQVRARGPQQRDAG